MTTKTGYEAIAQRLDDAYDHLVATLAELAEISEDDAKLAADFYIRERVVRRDASIGRYHAKHGAYLEPDIIVKAVKKEAGLK